MLQLNQFQSTTIKVTGLHPNDCQYSLLKRDLDVLCHCTRINPIVDRDLSPLSGIYEAKFPQETLVKFDP